jgi:hypothetical protein
VQAAIDVRDHIRQYKRGTIVRTLQYNGQTVGVFVSSHTWTYRNGVLVTGLCIPGASILIQQPANSVGTTLDDLSTPDPTAAVYGADDLATQPTDWSLVAVSAGAILTISALFALAIKHAGRAAGRGKR